MTTEVVIDATRLLGLYFAGRLPTGVDRVSLAYIKHYLHRTRALFRWRGRSGLFTKAASMAVLDALLIWNLSNRAMMRRLVAHGVLSCLWRGDGGAAFLLHTGHNDAESETLWRNIRWHRLRPVFFVHDLIPITHPQFCRAGEQQRHAQRLDRMLQGAAVIANSQSTLDQLHDYANAMGRAVPPNCVALLAAGSQFDSKPEPNQLINSSPHVLIHNPALFEQPYFVVLGTIEPRKNHALLINVWRNWGEDAALLVVIGQAGWDNQEVISQLNDPKEFGNRVVWIQDADDELLKRLVLGARALLFPSFVEGFGIPLAEALALGTPVIAGNLDVYREFAGNVPHYLPVNDESSWLKTVRVYAAENSLERNDQIERLRLLKLPTWGEHFNKVDELLDSLDLSANSHSATRLRSSNTSLSTTEHVLQGFSLRKKSILLRFLSAMGAHSEKREFVWGAKKQACPSAVGVEDGFIRSVGLGADLVSPLSWVFDTRGMYFDATKPSDLEWLLQNEEYSALQLQRAAKLRKSLITTGATKYNLSGQNWNRPTSLATQQVVLAVGQVESDASILLGSHTVRTNAQLLQAIRLKRPDAYIVYKPHPDVVAGLRSGGSASFADLRSKHQYADEVILDADMSQLLKVVDEVHVITSLSGFEALIRGVSVVVYGAPFYAGWGLTADVDLPVNISSRRTRKLKLDELVAATLIDYPVYIDPNLDVLITPEQALVVLQTQKALQQPDATLLQPLRRQLLKWWAILRGHY